MREAIGDEKHVQVLAGNDEVVEQVEHDVLVELHEPDKDHLKYDVGYQAYGKSDDDKDGCDDRRAVVERIVAARHQFWLFLERAESAVQTYIDIGDAQDEDGGDDTDEDLRVVPVVHDKLAVMKHLLAVVMVLYETEEDVRKPEEERHAPDAANNDEPAPSGHDLGVAQWYHNGDIVINGHGKKREEGRQKSHDLY